MGRKRILARGLSLVALDAAVFLIANHVAAAVIFKMTLRDFISRNFYFTAFIGTVLVMNFYFFDLYYTLKDFRRFRQAVNLVVAVSVSFVVSAVVVLLDRSVSMAGRHLLIFFAVILAGTAFNRMIFSLVSRNTVSKRAVFIGLNDSAVFLARRLEKMWSDGENPGIEIAGYISCPETPTEGTGGLSCLGEMKDLEKILKNEKISLMIHARKPGANGNLIEGVVAAKLRGIDLVSVGGLFSAITGQVPYEDVDEEWLIEECLRGNKFTEIRVKRILDVILATVFFILFLPVMLIIAIIVKSGSRGPVFYTQERIGRLGKPFRIIKFRSMTVEGPVRRCKPDDWYENNAHRINRMGHFLRRTHLDEIPQFLNIIKGDMSIVGPRPEMEMYIRQCQKAVPFYRLRLNIRPGLTGWAQVWYSHTSTIEGYKEKFRYDLFYLANLSLKLDLEIMARTVLRVMGYPRTHKFKEGR
ncbi:MAG: exopolysaccharide biosynthesis polyprenyl glycosylphosphotransferase [Candidatus Omnitrophota bacterium]